MTGDGLQVLVDQSGYELLNSGDMAMLLACLRAIELHVPGADVHVVTTAPERLAEIAPWAVAVAPAPRLPAVGPLAASRAQAAWRFAYKVLRPFAGPGRRRDGNSLMAVLSRADLVVSSGGGFVNDSFPVHALGVLSVLGVAQRRGVPTAMFGQGLGPLTHPWLARLARRVLPRLGALGLREASTGPQLARDLWVRDATLAVTGDEALALAGAGQPPAAGDSLGINVRVSKYAGVGDSAAADLQQVLDNFLSGRDARVVALPVSSYTKDSDLRSIAALAPTKARELILEELPRPEDLAAAVATCRAVMTGSYHVGVFALARGVPVVGLSKSGYYDAKFAGLRDLFPAGAVQSVSMAAPTWRADLQAALADAWELGPEVRRETAEEAARQVVARDEFVGAFLAPFAG